MQHASAIAVSIPLEIAKFLHNRGDEAATIEDIAVGTHRTEAEVKANLPEARTLIRRHRSELA